MKRFLILALATAPSAALAQPVLMSAPPVPEARVAMEVFGKCAVERRPGEAVRLLKMDFTSTAYRTGLRKLSEDVARDCARRSFGAGVMRSSDLLFAGAMAEALMEAEAAPLNARLVRIAASPVKTFSATDAVAQCLARSLPDQVAALFGTRPGSGAEEAAAAPLAEVIPVCARAGGVAESFELTVPAVRAMIATAAFRLLANSGDANA
ncbi:MAG: hypothetical protein B7Z08_03395 [Sphingomonadales bacterium 32-68-7]|nr:MAG: hypothetical protein B7Z33_05225 [Sphingomonadales bacterium 12-68-11]OYX09887.1 MAG: hypothetical protein B7Z08_03395 [Sphingomonadales bacterium 32-68-7]